MLSISASSDFKRIGDTYQLGYYDLSMLDSSNNIECINPVDAIDQAIENYILTDPGERLFNLNFGSPITRILFQNNVNTEEVRNNLYTSIEMALDIVIDRSTEGIELNESSHILYIHFNYSTSNGVILNHSFQRKFSS